MRRPKPLGGVVDRTFYIVRPKNGPAASDSIGTVLGKYAALHVAVAVCHTMSHDLLQHWGTQKLVIVESTVALAEGDLISRAAALRVFDGDGTRH
jgi:hypothetical protein